MAASCVTRAAGSGARSLSGVHFSKSESFHKRPAYSPSSIQSFVDDREIETSAPCEGANTSLAADGLTQQLDNIGIIEKAPDLSKIVLSQQLGGAFAMCRFAPCWISSTPILLGFARDGWCFEIFELHQCADRPERYGERLSRIDGTTSCLLVFVALVPVLPQAVTLSRPKRISCKALQGGVDIGTTQK
jgi:hypothetical protein